MLAGQAADDKTNKTIEEIQRNVNQNNVNVSQYIGYNGDLDDLITADFASNGNNAVPFWLVQKPAMVSWSKLWERFAVINELYELVCIWKNLLLSSTEYPESR